jgi:hypothetical protein
MGLLSVLAALLFGLGVVWIWVMPHRTPVMNVLSAMSVELFALLIVLQCWNLAVPDRETLWPTAAIASMQMTLQAVRLFLNGFSMFLGGRLTNSCVTYLWTLPLLSTSDDDSNRSDDDGGGGAAAVQLLNLVSSDGDDEDRGSDSSLNSAAGVGQLTHGRRISTPTDSAGDEGQRGEEEHEQTQQLEDVHPPLKNVDGDDAAAELNDDADRYFDDMEPSPWSSNAALEACGDGAAEEKEEVAVPKTILREELASMLTRGNFPPPQAAGKDSSGRSRLSDLTHGQSESDAKAEPATNFAVNHHKSAFHDSIARMLSQGWSGEQAPHQQYPPRRRSRKKSRAAKAEDPKFTDSQDEELFEL